MLNKQVYLETPTFKRTIQVNSWNISIKNCKFDYSDLFFFKFGTVSFYELDMIFESARDVRKSKVYRIML